MKNRYFKINLAMLAAVYILTGCGCADGAGADTVSENIADDEESDEDTSAGEYGTGNSGLITRADADVLIEEVLAGTGCTYSAAERIDTEDSEFDEEYAEQLEEYFVYTIACGDDILEQQLAVNPESGMVYVYDPLKGELSDFKAFEKYLPENDSNINWTGVYALDKYELIIEEDEPGSFSYAVYDEYKQLHQGFAQEKNHVSAVDNNNEKGEIRFSLKDDTITIETDDADFEYAGVYQMQ